MAVTRDDAAGTGAGWRKLAVLVLAVAAVGLPINDVGAYALLLVVAVAAFTGEVSGRLSAWAAALVIVAATIAGQWWLSPPRIDEGHNVFLPRADGVLQRALPPDVYRHLADEFDAAYPPSVRCKPGSSGCWQGSEPERAFAFSADSVLHTSDLSRSATTIDFSDPVWLRLGFINEQRYNWYTAAPDVHRVDRDRRFYMGLARWHLAMPWFEVIRLPAAYAGGELCWRGDLLWEAAGGLFALWRGDSCRAIEAADAGRRVFGVAIKPGALAMRLTPPWRVRLLQQYVQPALALAACIGLIVALVRLRARRTIVPLILVALSAAAIAVDDASFLGGVRPFDRGDDGLFYDGVGRIILQRLLSGDIAGFLQGGENVFYYGGPGLRYFRALEHVVFGESYLGYLTLVLLLPLLVYGLLRRFLPGRWPLATAIVFTAIPVGALFGTTFFQYAQWAGRGFADPAAYILFTAGLLMLVRATEKFPAAFSAALLFALAIFMKPIVAPAAAVLLGGAGIWALTRQQWPRLAGLCIGFLPVLSMALHNWAFGHVFVLFSANSADANLLVMPPAAWLAALHDGPQAARAAQQIVHWLSGPAQVVATIPVNAALVAAVIYVAAGRRFDAFDPWLRLIAGAALAQHAVALFYDASTARYHFLAWLLALPVGLVWLQQVGIVWLQRRYPDLCLRIAAQPLSLWLASGLARLHKVSA